MVTTYAKQKPFAWSYSKLKNFDTCPKRYYEVDVTKNFKDEESEQLKWGGAVHKALAARLLPGKVTLPPGMEEFEGWAEKVDKFPGQLFVEQQYAITIELRPTEWFGRDVWFRSIADVVKVSGDRALAIDWKTGKVVEDSQQLALMAMCIFAHFPDVYSVDTIFVWLKDDAYTHEKYERKNIDEIWLNVMPRVKQLQFAHDTMQFPPKPGFLCRKWCPVASCEYYGQ